MTSNYTAFVIDLIIYISVVGFTSYAAVYALPLGVTLFSGSMLLCAFVSAAYSLFRLFTRDTD